ncbi:antitoxin [Streptomyces sp. NPDC001795]|uniref:antitoxin n=1 Tax=unclassified Streptomyces TaxID=2593676 RepID=UPI0033247C09
MSVMDRLKQMLKGHEQAGKGIDKGGEAVDEKTRGKSGQVDKGPDALREQLRSQQEKDTPPEP